MLCVSGLEDDSSAGRRGRRTAGLEDTKTHVAGEKFIWERTSVETQQWQQTQVKREEDKQSPSKDFRRWPQAVLRSSRSRGDGQSAADLGEVQKIRHAPSKCNRAARWPIFLLLWEEPSAAKGNGAGAAQSN